MAPFLSGHGVERELTGVTLITHTCAIYYECMPPSGVSLIIFWLLKQELSYRKQIACKLRTQYVEGIYRPKYYTVTLKSRSRVTQGHWKWNHWTDHTQLTISRVT